MKLDGNAMKKVQRNMLYTMKNTLERVLPQIRVGQKVRCSCSARTPFLSYSLAFCADVCVCAWTIVHSHECVCVCVCMRVYVYVYVCVFLSVGQPASQSFLSLFVSLSLHVCHCHCQSQSLSLSLFSSLPQVHVRERVQIVAMSVHLVSTLSLLRAW
jgi:hypothetical protein